MTEPVGPLPDAHFGAELPGQRRRSHPITPLIHSVRTMTLLAGVLVLFGNNGLSDLAQHFGLGVALLGLLVGAVLLLAVSLGLHYLSWQRTEFYFDAVGDFHLDSGVVSRNERRVALSRLQSVDVTRPLLGRLFGMAAVRVEVAGAGDSHVEVSYLTESQAAALRAGILARAAGVRSDAGEAPEVVLASVPTQDLLWSLLLRSETIALTLLTLVIVGSAVVAEGAQGAALLIVTGGVPILAVAGQFSRFFNFTVADSPDGLRLRFGLLRTEAQTVPPGRVQAVELVEPLLWRRRGWVRVRLNVAGAGGSEDGQTSERVLLPVAPAQAALAIIARIMPGVSVDLAQPGGAPLVGAPARARRRAWLQYDNIAVGAGAQVLVTRRGFLTRRTALIPHARTQSVRVTQGPWQRALGLASLHVDTTPGPVQVVGLHQDAGAAREMAQAQLLRAAAARAAGPPARWLAEGVQHHRADIFGAAPDLGDDGAHEGDRDIAAGGRQPE